MEFIEYLKAKRYSTSTQRASQVTINIYLAWVAREQLQPHQITYQDLLSFMKACRQRGVTQKTIKHYLNTIKHYYNHQIEAGQIAINPTIDIEVKGIKRHILYHILEPDQLENLHNLYPNQTYRDKRNKVMLGLLVFQGIRTEELGRLTVQDILLENGLVDLLGSRKNNGRKLRLEAAQIMGMSDYILNVRPEILAMPPKRKSQQKQVTDRLFINEGGNCSSISNMMSQLMIKVSDINPSVVNAYHVRASVIAQWIKEHGLRKAQYLAGHRYVSSTENYLQNDMEELKEEMLQYHPLG